MDNHHKRFRIEPKSYNVTRNYTPKRHRLSHSDNGVKKSKLNNCEPQAYIFDSGGHTIKLGHTSLNDPLIVPNCIMKAKSERKRPFIGSQIEDCRDLSGLYYLLPCEKGYITKWDVQKPVWDYALQKHPIKDLPIIMTQPVYNFRSIQECIDEIFFEEYEVKSMYKANPTDLARYQYVKTVKGTDTSCIIVDSGYSFTHVVPYINGKKYFPGIIRIDVGGKLLTNYLKDIISYRQLHVMEETYVINQVKEDTCFVSADLKQDMKIASCHGSENTIVRNYVLPDFNNIRRGYTQESGSKTEMIDGCQILRLNNERFTVPELLIHPSNIGMESMGIAEAIAKCILKCPQEEQPILSQNIVLIGGNSHFPGYKDRICSEIRSLLPAHLLISAYKPDNGINYPWLGGKTLSKDHSLQSKLVFKYEYEEYGSKYTYKKLNDWSTAEIMEPQKELEVKYPKISLMDNITGINIFGKTDDEEMEEKSPSNIISPFVSIMDTTIKKVDRVVNENKLLNYETKQKITTIPMLRPVTNNIQLCKPPLLAEKLAIRFISVSDVCLRNTKMFTSSNLKFS